MAQIKKHPTFIKLATQVPSRILIRCRFLPNNTLCQKNMIFSGFKKWKTPCWAVFKISPSKFRKKREKVFPTKILSSEGIFLLIFWCQTAVFNPKSFYFIFVFRFPTSTDNFCHEKCEKIQKKVFKKDQKIKIRYGICRFHVSKMLILDHFLAEFWNS